MGVGWNDYAPFVLLDSTVQWLEMNHVGSDESASRSSLSTHGRSVVLSSLPLGFLFAWILYFPSTSRSLVLVYAVLEVVSQSHGGPALHPPGCNHQEKFLRSVHLHEWKKKKKDANELIYITESNSQTLKPTCGYKEGEVAEGWMRRLGATSTHHYMENREPTRTYCGAQETLFNTL